MPISQVPDIVAVSVIPMFICIFKACETEILIYAGKYFLKLREHINESA